MWVRSLGQEDPLKEGRITYFNIPAWNIPWTESLVGYSPRGHKVKTQLKQRSTHTQSAYPKVVSKAHSLFYIFSNVTFSVRFFWLLFSCSVMSNTLQPHGLQHARLVCPSLSPRACSHSCPLSQWRQLSSVVPFSSHLQSFLTSGSFPVSRLFASDGQNIRASASVSVLPMNIQDWFHLGWTCWISLQSKGLSRVFSNTTVQNSSALSLLYRPALTSIREYCMHVRWLSLSLTILKQETHT